MKKLLLPFLILLFFTNSVAAQENETTITGKIIGEVPEELLYTVPVNGTFNRDVNQSLKPNSNGEFHIKIKIDSPTFIEIKVVNRISKTFVVEPEKNYDLVLDFETKKKEELSKMFSNGEKLLYQDFPIAGNINWTAGAIGKNKTILDIKEDISLQKEKSIKVFKALLEQKKISRVLFDFIKIFIIQL